MTEKFERNPQQKESREQESIIVRCFEVEGKEADVRYASQEDYQAVADIFEDQRRLRAERDHKLPEKPADDEMLEASRRIDERDKFIVLVSEIEDLVCGYVELGWYGGDTAFVHAITVLEKYQGKKLGKELMESCISEAQNRFNVKNIELSVIAQNKNAVSLYNKLGFKEKEIQKGVDEWDNKPADRVSMVKHLNSGK